jgi:DeoR family transcriptional regulator, fructose operon transcriptional repressor
MYAAERQHRLVERARTSGRVEVRAAADELDVTPETIRRDLSELERQGLLRRVHGGAMPIERLGFEPELATRASIAIDEKMRIAKAAVAEVPSTGSILLDAGTTTARLADLLPTDRALTVVTNAVPIALSLSARPNLTLLMVGGRVRGRTQAAVDAWSLDALAVTYVDVAFVGANGFSVPHGLTTPDQSEAATKRAMVRAARRTIVLADSKKLDQDCFARFADLGDVDTLITDDGLSPEAADALAAAGPRVLRA